jgi:hypothetical protein
LWRAGIEKFMRGGRHGESTAGWALTSQFERTNLKIP